MGTDNLVERVKNAVQPVAESIAKRAAEVVTAATEVEKSIENAVRESKPVAQLKKAFGSPPPAVVVKAKPAAKKAAAKRAPVKKAAAKKAPVKKAPVKKAAAKKAVAKKAPAKKGAKSAKKAVAKKAPAKKSAKKAPAKRASKSKSKR